MKQKIILSTGVEILVQAELPTLCFSDGPAAHEKCRFYDVTRQHKKHCDLFDVQLRMRKISDTVYAPIRCVACVS